MVDESNVPQLVDKKGVKEGLFQQQNIKGAIKLESQWSNDERMMVNQDEHVKSIIISCVPDDIMESLFSYETTKATWTDLVHSFEDLHPLQDLLNELANDGVNLSKHEINVGSVNSLPEKWLTLS
ncbi:hypothetical protein Tco_0373478 [Tanacetum coccineum]